MNLTNKHNLPQSLVNAVTNHSHKGGFLSASQTTKSVRQYWLTKRHYDDITEDVSDRIWALFGTACHSVFEQNTTDGISEEYMSQEINGKTITGKADYYINGKITDYKTVSVWSIIYMSSLEDWTKQLNVYAYLFRKAGHEVNELEIMAVMRDWQKSKAKEENYPSIQVQAVPVPLWTLEEQEEYITACIDKLLADENTKDDDLPYCNRQELWQDDDKFAVMKKGRKTAVRLLDSQEKAEEYIEAKGLDDKHYIEKREGKPKRCEYCSASAFCNQYKELFND